MKIVQKLLAACLLTGGLMATAYAADKVVLPDSIGGEPTRVEVAKNSLKKDAICTKCHDESENAPILTLYQTKHGLRGDSRTPNCQSCHGESEKHVKGIKDKDDTSEASKPAPDVVFKKGVYQKSDAKTQAGACITCHQGGKRMHWDGSAHESRDVPCASCHSVHKKSDPVLTKRTQPEVCFTCHKTQRAETHKISTHPIDAGKMACSDCHNPHGSVADKLLVKKTVNETCYQCHAEKRGPFLWEHAPVVDDCTNCHTPHGSSTTPLLKTRAPFLCQECHDGHGGYATGTGLPSGGAPAVAANGRACVNCHVMIHGSNSPGGKGFHR